MLQKALLALPALIAAGRCLAVPSSSDDGSHQTVFRKTEDIEALSFEGWQEIQRAAAGIVDVVRAAADGAASASHAVWTDAKTATQQAEDRLEDLSADAWQQIQDRFDDVIDSTLNVVDPIEVTKQKVEEETAPWHDHDEPLDLSKWTIGQILNWTLKHAHDEDTPTLPLHKLAYLVNVSTPVQEILSDPKADLTFFAPSDDALTPPSRRHHRHGHGREPHFASAVADPVGGELAIAGQHPFWKAARQFQREACPGYRKQQAKLAALKGDKGDDDRKEKRRRFFKELLKAVLEYHVSPGTKTPSEILDSNTLSTVLKIGHEKNDPSFRIRVGEPSLLPHVPVKLNFFSALSTRPIKAKNGVIYIIEEAPLLPPLSPLSLLFLFPEPFSTLTSAVQKVGLAHPLLPHIGNHTLPLSVGADDDVDERVMVALKDIAEEQHKLTKRSFTVFAPTNRAFHELGFELNAFLFSPFGTRVLRYILSYHVVPDIIFHSDHIDNVTWTQGSVSEETNVPWPESLDWFSLGTDPKGVWDGPHFPKPPRPPHGPTPPGQVNVTHYALPTLLGSAKNETLNVDIVSYRLRLGHGPLARRIVVKPSPYGPKRGPHGPLKPFASTIADGVAWGGAVHTLPHLIAPPFPPGHHDRHHGRESDPLDELTSLARKSRFAVPNFD